MSKKSFFFLLCSFFAMQMTAQTAAIAHKSHSGKSNTIPAEKDGGFGLPPRRIQKVIKIDAETVVEVPTYDYYGKDTTRNHPTFCNPNISLDSLKRRYPRIEFEGFERFEKPKKPQKSQNKSKKGSAWKALDYPLPPLQMTLGVLTILSICAAGAYLQYRSDEMA